ncbi:hypothetical protein J2X50_003823 [Aminobacter sp. BE322]
MTVTGRHDSRIARPASDHRSTTLRGERRAAASRL